MVSQDKHCETVFPEAPLVAFRRQRNIREAIVRAKVVKPPNGGALARRHLVPFGFSGPVFDLDLIRFFFAGAPFDLI